MSMLESMGPPLERLRLRFGSSRAAAFLRWWGGQLWGWLPQRMRGWLLAGRSRCWLDASGTPVAALGEPAADPERAAVWLLIPAARVLRRRLRFPAAAGGRIDDLLRHEIDRQTPFRADEVSHAWRPVPGPAAAGQLEVELVVLPLAGLEQALSGFGEAALRLEGVDVADADGNPLGVNLLPVARRHRRRDPWARRRLVLLVALVGLVFFSLWQSLENRRHAVSQLQAAIELQREEARRASVLRGQLEDSVEGGDFLARHRAGQVSAVALLDELSRQLPDDTWLERISFNQGQVRLTGFSSEVAGLIGRLQQSGILSSPGLVGSVQSDPQTRRDRFTVVAQARSNGGDDVGTGKD